MLLQRRKSVANVSAFLRQPNHLPEPGPHHSAGHSDARRVLCVSFNHRVAVCPTDGYDCRGQWMRAAADSMRCRRGIEQTELIFAPVLNENIYDIVTGPLVNVVVNGFFSKRQLQSAVDWFCGHCCVCFFILRSRDISLPRFLTYFTHDTGLSGVVVRGALCKIIND